MTARADHTAFLLNQIDLERLKAVWADLDHLARHSTSRKPQRQAEAAAKALGWLIDYRQELDGTDEAST